MSLTFVIADAEGAARAAGAAGAAGAAAEPKLEGTTGEVMMFSTALYFLYTVLNKYTSKLHALSQSPFLL